MHSYCSPRKYDVGLLRVALPVARLHSTEQHRPNFCRKKDLYLAGTGLS